MMAPGISSPRKIRVSKGSDSTHSTLPARNHLYGKGMLAQVSKQTDERLGADNNARTTAHLENQQSDFYADMVEAMGITTLLVFVVILLYAGNEHTLPFEQYLGDNWWILYMITLFGTSIPVACLYAHLKRTKPWISKRKKQERLDRYVREKVMTKSDEKKLIESRIARARIHFKNKEGGHSDIDSPMSDLQFSGWKTRLMNDANIDLDRLIKEHPEGCLIEKIPETGRYNRLCTNCHLESEDAICPYCGNESFIWKAGSSTGYSIKIGEGGYRMVIK